jgi:hypothetical protein
MPRDPSLHPRFGRLARAGLLASLLLLGAGPAAGAQDETPARRLQDILRLDGILGVRYQIVHVGGLDAVYDSALEEYLGMNLTGELAPELDFLVSLNVLRPNEEKTDPTFDMGKLPLDNYVLQLRYQGWLTRFGFLWGSLTPLTYETTSPNVYRPLLFDRNPDAGEEKVSEFYRRSFEDGFLKDQVQDPLQVFVGGRGGYNWIYRPLMGLHVENLQAPWGGYCKFYLGKDESHYADQTYLMNFGAQVGLDFQRAFDAFPLRWEVNAFDQSNDRGELAANGLDPESVLQNNTVLSTVVKLPMTNLSYLEVEYARSYYDSGGLNLRDWAARASLTIFLERGLGVEVPLPLTLQVRRINPDFVAKQSAMIGAADTGGGSRQFWTNMGDPQMYYGNEQAWFLDWKTRSLNTLLRVIYGGREQLQETGNRVSATHFLDGNNYNGAVWWHLFFDNGGTAPNPAAQRYSANSNFTRTLETDWWRGNTETLTLPETTPGRKSISLMSVDLRHHLNRSLGFETPTYLQLYTEAQALHRSFSASPFFASDALFFQSYSQAVLAYNLVGPVFLVAEGGIELWRSDQIAPVLDYIEDSVGLGFDWALDARTALYVRGKRYRHHDRVLAGNDFTSQQWWLELKNYF